MDRYQVVAPYVTVPTMTQRGTQVVGLLKGAFVPEDAPADWVKRHLRKKLIEKVELGAAPLAMPEESGNQDEEVPPPAPTAPPGQETPQAPPESGPGSGKQAWVDYAVARGMDRDEAGGMSRDDLISALRED